MPRAVFLLVGCVGFGLALRAGQDTPNPPAGMPSPATASQPLGDMAARLVERLGAPRYADREAAGKALRELGKSAEPALRAGVMSQNAEVRARSLRLLDAVQSEHLRAVYVKLAGDDKDARDLFALIAASPRAVDTLKAALDDPSQLDELYLTRTAELLRVAAGHSPVDAQGKASVPTDPDVWAPPPPPLGDVAGWLFLGALQSGKSPWRVVTHAGWHNRLSSHVPFLPEDDYTSAMPIAAAYESDASGPLKKLTSAWLEKRRENDMLRAGLALAIRYDIAAVNAGRVVLKETGPDGVRPWNLAAAAVLVGLHGTKDDLPLLARHAADEWVYATFLNLPRSTGPPVTFRAHPVKDGRDLRCQVRDAAVVAMCLLGGKDPAEFDFPRFPATKHPNGKPMPLSSATGVGFRAQADRVAAFAKAKAWLDEQRSIIPGGSGSQ